MLPIASRRRQLLFWQMQGGLQHASDCTTLLPSAYPSLLPVIITICILPIASRGGSRHAAVCVTLAP